MGWKEEIKDFKGASFKGAFFKVDDSTLEFGWNVTVKTTPSENQQFVNKDTGEVLSIGTNEAANDPKIEKGTKGPRTIALTAHFDGADYLTDRNAFIAAVEEGTPGLLRLPLMRDMVCYAARGSTRYSNKSGGYEDVSITFIETSDESKNDTVVNRARQAEDLSEDIAEKAKATAEETLDDVSGIEPSKLTVLAQKVSDTFASVFTAGAIGDTYSTFVENVQKVAEDLNTIITAPGDFIYQIYDITDSMRQAFLSPIDAVRGQIAVFDAYRTGLQFDLNGSEARRLEVVANKSVSSAVEIACIVGACLAAVDTDFDTLDDAIDTKAELDRIIKAERERLADEDGYEDVYDEMNRLLLAVSEYISSSANLAISYDITVSDKTPVLAIVADYYGDAERYEEFITRNNIRNPLFCQNDLEVLSR